MQKSVASTLIATALCAGGALQAAQEGPWMVRVRAVNLKPADPA